MANDYYALMQALQATKPNPMNTSAQAGVGAFQKIMQAVLSNKVKKDIEGKISAAEKSGKKVSYSIDPNTGQITPTFSSKPNLFELLEENPSLKEKYEIGASASGDERLIKKKEISASKIAGMKKIIDSPDDLFKVRNTIGGEDVDFDIKKDEDIGDALVMAGILKDGKDWREHPEILEAGFPAMIDARREKKSAESKVKEEKKPNKVIENLKKVLGAPIGQPPGVQKWAQSKGYKEKQERPQYDPNTHKLQYNRATGEYRAVPK